MVFQCYCANALSVRNRRLLMHIVCSNRVYTSIARSSVVRSRRVLIPINRSSVRKRRGGVLRGVMCMLSPMSNVVIIIRNFIRGTVSIVNARAVEYQSYRVSSCCDIQLYSAHACTT